MCVIMWWIKEGEGGWDGAGAARGAYCVCVCAASNVCACAVTGIFLWADQPIRKYIVTGEFALQMRAQRSTGCVKFPQ